MRNLDFFQEIVHHEVPWRERSMYLPFFYYDVMMLGAQFLAPMDRVKALLPSRRMHPLRVTPWHSVISIATFEYRDCDFDEPYNEVSIGIPFTLDEVSPLFTGILRKVPEVLKLYNHHLPVTTEIARDVGVEFGGYPKFLASIEFEKKGGWISCHLSEGNKHVLTLAGRELELHPVPRYHMQPITIRGGRMLRCDLTWSEREEAASKKSSDFRLIYLIVKI